MDTTPSLRRLCIDLISIPSVTDDMAACEQAIRYVRSLLDVHADVRCDVYESNGHLSLVAAPDDVDPKTVDVLLQAHIDVVPAPAACFAPVVQDDTLLGRGAYDMKGVAAVLIRTFLQQRRSASSLSVGLMLTTDEEVGGFDGVGYLVQEKGFRPHCVILPDGGEDFSLIERQFGVVWVNIRCKGIATHTSRPEGSINAIDMLYRKVRAFRDAVDTLPDTLCALSGIQGGEATNIVPGHCTATLDIRTLQPQSIPPLLAEYFEPDEYEILLEEPSFHLDLSHPVVGLYRECLARHSGREPPLITERGGSDARFFGEHGIPVLLSSVRGGRHHCDDEWVSVQSLESYECFLQKLLPEIAALLYKSGSTVIHAAKQPRIAPS